MAEISKHLTIGSSTRSFNSPHLTLFDELKLFDYIADEYLHRISIHHNTFIFQYPNPNPNFDL